MFFGNLNLTLVLERVIASFLGEVRFDAMFNVLAANDAVGYGDYDKDSRCIRLYFSQHEHKLKRKSRLTGSPIEKFMSVRDMLTIDLNEAVGRLIASGESIPNEVGLEFVFDAELMHRVHADVVSRRQAAVTYGDKVDEFLDWLADHLWIANWRGDGTASFTGTIDLRRAKQISPELFERHVKAKREHERKTPPSLTF